MQTVESSVATARHPLDPLSATEVAAASRILKQKRGLADSARFVYVTLLEPPKAEVLAFEPGQAIERAAFVMIRERVEKRTYEAVVSITRAEVVSWREAVDQQAPITAEEFLQCEQVVKADSRWQEAMRRRGLTDFENAMIDPWSLGYNGPEEASSHGRKVRPLTWLRKSPHDHGYARPVEGLLVTFDLDRMEVVGIEDHGVVPLPPNDANYTPEAISDAANFPHFPAGPRSDLKTIDITQPEGTSFTVDGWEIRWQKWRMRVGFNPREGLVLHQIGYEDQGRLRPIIYRAGLAEMFIPYGDPAPTHRRKNVFDMGEYGVGVMANSLELGCDCLGEIYYFDGVLNDQDGNPLPVKNAICLHEEDHGILWKHLDMRTGDVEVRRSRRLVVSMIATIGNYEYGYFWYFYQDGGIGYEIKLSGVISNGAFDPAAGRPKYGTVVAPGVYGPNHQHFFCVRLDMMVDGLQNSVVECDSVAVPPGPDNPYGNAWVVRETLLEREAEAQRLANTGAGRFWKIVNPSRKNALGDPVAYRLDPGPSTGPLYQPGAHALNRALFTTKNLWVTAYDPKEMFAAGDYPNQHPGGAGLPAYVAADRPVADADLVVWHTFVAHHVVRPEDWPVMPVTYCGFLLRPFGFFDGSPALDVPDLHHHHHSNGNGASSAAH